MTNNNAPKIPHIINRPEALQVVNQAMQEMSANRSPGQPGGPSVAIIPGNPNVNLSPSKEVLATLAKIAT